MKKLSKQKRKLPGIHTLFYLFVSIFLLVNICIFSSWLKGGDFNSLDVQQSKQSKQKLNFTLSSNNFNATEKLIVNGFLQYEEANTPTHLNNAPASNKVYATIAYAVSLTSCGRFLLDGAAVLKRSIQLSSYPFADSNYKSKMYVFAHPSTSECIEQFRDLGYEILLKEVPINVTEIKGNFLREKVIKTGCCGEKEYLKLYSYTLTDHPIVVHLDLDSLIIQPLDELFDAMLEVGNRTLDVPVMFGTPLPQKIDAFFTRDYNMVNLGHKHVGLQGGFIVVKPNLDYFEEYKQVILKGDFVKGAGWEGKYGGYWGAQQIQGLCSYFFDGLHPGTAVELDRCIYNNMADDPQRQDKDGTMKCLDGKDKCKSCRATDALQIKSTHFTLCAKPWVCPIGKLSEPVCKFMHQKWFSIRKDLEEELGTFDATGDYHTSTFFGYCKGVGERNYIPFKLRGT